MREESERREEKRMYEKEALHDDHFHITKIQSSHGYGPAINVPFSHLQQLKADSTRKREKRKGNISPLEHLLARYGNPKK